MKYRALLAAAILTLAACTAPASVTASTVPGVTTTPTSSPGTPTSLPGTPTSSPAAVTPGTTSCDNPPEAFQPLCTAYHIITTSYVDPVDDSRLAEGAARAITEHESEPGATAPDSLTCALPSPAFAQMCNAFVEEELTDPAPTPDLVAAAISGMLQYGLDDPYSVYFSPDALARFQEETSGQIEGIGALVRSEDTSTPEDGPCSTISDTCQLVIVTPLEGGPAEGVGLRSGDIMTTVDGESIDGWLVDEVIAEVRGPAGTDVTLGILRDGTPLEFTITRAAIDIPIVSSRMIDDSIGYLELTIFATNAPHQVDTALRELLDAGATTIILDLQHDPGGSLNSAIFVASEFLSDGLVLRTEAPGDTEEYPVTPGGIATDPSIALYVLVDRASASASEVVTGAFMDAGRATVIGEHTFGKNTVQQQFNLGNGGALKLTVARWVTPKGHDYGKVGLTPDILIEIPDGAEPDFLLNKALEIIRG
ncbi:putative CtpA-like serine protease [bacterium BMS3Abin02]|nr:putative CtpA-like serine protease [bacterium BMS3Abin02]HDK45695.1 S41 family peptidase [Actinomycetota bacterium]HDL49429.1 S41 family peptidase [Actinomycetota bacterium]